MICMRIFVENSSDSYASYVKVQILSALPVNFISTEIDLNLVENGERFRTF